MRNYKIESSSRFHSSSGIVIGPILFVIFLLGILTVAVASSPNNFGIILSVDKITNEVYTQANLIRNTIIKCKTEFDIRRNLASFGEKQLCPRPKGGGYPLSLDVGSSIEDLRCSSLAQAIRDTGECGFFINDAFVSDSNPSEIGASIWASGTDDIIPPTGINKEFTEWKYVNDMENGGGVCFWIAPRNPDTSNPAFIEGLQRAADKFRRAKTMDGSIDNNIDNNIKNNSEVIFDPSAPSQKFIFWLVPPSAGINPNCEP